MITTVTLNPCIDHTITIASLNHGHLNAVEKSRRDFGGKGINVSMAAKNLGLETRAITIGFSQSMRQQTEFLSENGIEHLLVQAEGALRTNVKIFENNYGLMTEFNEKGRPISEETVLTLEKEILNCAKNTEIIVFGGSLCQGIPVGFYNTLIAKCKAENPNVKVILDTSGIPFIEGLKAVPYAIKPNLSELETAFDVKLSSVDEIISISKEIISSGVEIVCVSMGKDGAVIVTKNEAFIASPPEIDVKSIQGAGDSMVAGLCLAILEHKPPKDILRYGMSMASATILREGTLMGLKPDFAKFLKKIQVTALYQSFLKG